MGGWPEKEAQLQAVQRELDPTLATELCLTVNPAEIRVLASLENIAAGHSFPSGAAQDRRVWVEIIAYDADGQIVAQSGVVEEGQPLVTVADAWRLGDRTYDDQVTRPTCSGRWPRSRAR